MKLRVDVQQVCDDPQVPPARDIERWAEAAAEQALQYDAQLCVRIVDEAEGATLNLEFRERHGPTNVLSFPFEAPEHTRPPLLGDVVICAPVVAREARQQGKPVNAHYAHLVVHGVLHLLGHEHDDPVEATRMEGLERRVLAELGIVDPYRDDEEGAP
jgi:probable rRNA maturation factor